MIHPHRLAGFGPIALLVASMVSLCVGTSLAKTLFPVAGAAGTTALRIGLAAMLLIAVQRPWRWHLSPVQWRAVVAYGLVLACMNLSFYAALRTLPLGIAIAIEFLGPLGVAVAYSRRWRDFASIALAAGGVALLVLRGEAVALDPVGVGFALLAALFWALYIVIGKRATAVLPERRIVCLGLAIAALIAVPAGVWQAGATLLRPEVLAAGAVVALLSSALPYFLELLALKRLPPAVFGITVSLEPAIGALAALAILGEQLDGRQWIGIAAVMTASIATTLSQPRPPLAMPA